MRDFPILEPLCEATRDALRPLDFLPSDSSVFLISLDLKHGRSFRIAVGRAPRLRESAAGMIQHHRDNGKTFVKDETGEERVVISYGASLNIRDWMNRVPEAKHLGRKGGDDDVWRVAVTDISVLLIHHAIPRERLVFTKDAKIAYELTLMEFFLSNSRAKIQAEFKSNRTVPSLPPGYDSGELKLSDYQQTAVGMALHQSLALFMEQGTGKTATAISLMCEEARQAFENTGESSIVLIVCPRQVRENWRREFERFATVPFECRILRGSQGARISVLAKGIEARRRVRLSVLIVSVDTQWRDVEVLSSVPWARIVVDESHLAKAPRSERWKGLRELRDSAKHRLVMTGTPCAGSIMDLWTQLEFLGEGRSGFQSFAAFKSFYGKFVREKRGQDEYDRLVGYENLPMIHERLSRLAFVLSVKEAGLELPPAIPSLWEVELPKKHYEIYQSLSRRLVAEIDQGVAKGTITTDHILTKLLRLAQITSGFIKLDDQYDAETQEVHGGSVRQIDDENPKVKECLEMMKDLGPNDKAIFWAVFVEDIRVLNIAMREAGYNPVTYYGATSEIEREEALRQFNTNPDCRVFIGNPASAGTGLNLLGHDPAEPEKYVTDTTLVCFFSRNWSFIQADQAAARALRRGTRRPVTMRQLFVPGTIDEVMVEAVDRKASTASLVKDLSGILNRVLGTELDLESLVS